LPPLAERIRPHSLEEFAGQKHLVGPNGILRKLIENDQLVSLILWGPPGCGKTTLAKIIANNTKSCLFHFSAVTASLDDFRKVVAEAKERLSAYGQKTILFMDEIHRLNKAQQDAFLPHVEDGTIILIGATTENPSFEVIGPLLSRSRVLVLNQLAHDDLQKIIERGEKELKVRINSKAREFLIESCNGDARIALNAIEIAASLAGGKRSLGIGKIEDALQRKSLTFDRNGEEHYNTISAFIKSMRASNVDAALYYLARMVEAGEDPLFIARRMVVFASEDIGMAQPTALVVANEVFQACHEIGFPECQENLAHGAVYLALARKDRSAVDAYFEALKDVKKYGNLSIPLKILNAPTKFLNTKDLLPEKLRGKRYYHGKE